MLPEEVYKSANSCQYHLLEDFDPQHLVDESATFEAFGHEVEIKCRQERILDSIYIVSAAFRSWPRCLSNRLRD